MYGVTFFTYFASQVNATTVPQ